jgi:Uma2 family endonuclease
MVEARRAHGTIVGNLMRELGLSLKGSPCRVFSQSTKVQVADDTILYPDLFVTCDRDDLRTEMIFRAPLLVVEVLSPTTQAWDRSRKFVLYRRLPSLREVVLVDPDTRDVQAFRRSDSDQWVLHDITEDAVLRLPCTEAEVAMVDAFGGVEPAGRACSAQWRRLACPDWSTRALAARTERGGEPAFEGHRCAWCARPIPERSLSDQVQPAPELHPVAGTETAEHAKSREPLRSEAVYAWHRYGAACLSQQAARRSVPRPEPGAVTRGDGRNAGQRP